jgi:hypothetical protein
VITPRWLFVLAGATPTSYGLPRITDETLEPFDISSVQPRRHRRRRDSQAVTAHGGEIRIRNMPGNGSVFIIDALLAAAESASQAVS